MERYPINEESEEPPVEDLQGISAAEAARMNQNQTVEEAANSPAAQEAIRLAETDAHTTYIRQHGAGVDNRKYQ